MDIINKIKSHNFKNYKNSTHSIYHSLPLKRRSSVFILLFHYKNDLKVLLTQRSSQLRHFPGHVSLPGGKADSPLEDEWMTARREMEEELGISRSNDTLKAQHCEIIKLGIMSSYLSRTFSCVRPVVGYLKMDEGFDGLDLKLNPGETSCVFSVSLRDFLWPDEPIQPRRQGHNQGNGSDHDSDVDNLSTSTTSSLIDKNYEMVKWGGVPWKLRSYIVHRNNEVDWISKVVDLSDDSDTGLSPFLDEDQDPGQDDSQDGSQSQEPEVTDSTSSDVHQLDTKLSTPITNGVKKRKLTKEEKADKRAKLSAWGRLGSTKTPEGKNFDVWGLTANILHDLSVVAYSEITSEIGEEELIHSLYKAGQMRERNEIEKKLGTGEIGFGKVLDKEDFNYLKRLYKILIILKLLWYK